MASKQEIRTRLNALKDPNGIIQACQLSITNYALEFNRIVEEEDMVQLELFEAQQSFLNSAESARIAESEARKYLASTDWYIIREMDSGVACPEEIKTARAAARLQIGN